ncbi:hypothetical protein GALMADRAFT_232674 [Galerina marginata CBS 339.88]|uniref:FHA domain-containing protein n=1 Tax=Galerina marginata (strain CBS 339.88) TaxID=685588 RepID=A0A067SHC8_GALM3|nr:hypothetical protein GALMADRAFT_232674 [Galerina marginata CBS 339.88]
MWVILGPFDGEVVGDVAFQKAKLLKPNTSYTVGRKDRPLLINNKKISHDHCEIIVGNHTTDDVSDPTMRPSLEISHTNKKGKALRITKPDDAEGVAPVDAKTALEDGDRVSLITGVVLQVSWRPICAYYSPSRGKASISLDSCAVLGIKLVNKLQENITHHLATHYVANLEMTSSLLALCRIVKPEWLVEVIRLGNLPRNNEESNGVSLEDHFILPQETKFRPVFSPSLLPSQKAFDIWEPNEERVNFFAPLRFICLFEKVTQVDSEVREAIHRGGGTLEVFDIHSSIPKFHKALTRSQAKDGKQTVVVGDVDAMQTAIGTEDWGKMVSEARSFGLDILPPAKLIQSVLDVNLVFLQSNAMEAGGANDGARHSSPLPEMVPNSIPDEPSVQPDTSSQATASRRKLVRRATSREPSAPPEVSEPPPPPQQSSRRRPLTRRVAGGQPMVTGLEDPSAVLDGIPDLRKTPPPQPAPASTTAPTPARTSKLKRRVGIGGPDSLGLDSQMSGIGQTIGEPPLKKFKALFEASNPGGPEPDSLDLVESMDHSQTQTQTQAQNDRPFNSMGASSLAVLREEEEETQSGHAVASQQRPPKRTLDSVDEDEEMEIGGILAPSNGSPPAAKKRAVENVNAVDRTNTAADVPSTSLGAPNKPPSTIAPSVDKQGGAPAGKPDTDAAFLKAIASTKKGKKTEDAFDREFNKLKISKPEMEQKDPEEEWGVLADFGDDSGLRGNFMVVVEMEPYKKDGFGQHRSLPNHSWDGKPDFKKFKKKIIGGYRAKVDLFVSEENDYGIGASYWKGGHSQTQTQQTFMESQTESQAPAPSQRQGSRKPRTQTLRDSDEDEPAVVPRSRKPPSKSETKAPATKRSTGKSKASAKANALFLEDDEDDDDDIQEIIGVDGPNEPPRTRTQGDEEQTLQSSAETKAPVGRRPTRTTKAPKKPAPIIVDDDSDDGAVFKGFKGRKGGR